MSIENLADKASQLEAMLTILTGDGFKTFGNWSESTQHDYLCACQSFANDIRTMTGEMLQAA